jgi:hypothetical protein
MVMLWKPRHRSQRLITTGTLSKRELNRLYYDTTISHTRCSTLTMLERIKPSLILVRKPRKSLLLIAAIPSIILASVFAFFVVWGFYDFRAHYLDIMRNLNDPQTKSAIGANFTQPYNQTELIEWERTYLKFVPMNETYQNRTSDPVQILKSGKGRCEEFAILYVSACLARGYEARLVVARQFYNFWTYGEHGWAEVKVNGTWIHVDSSLGNGVWNEPLVYKSRHWSWAEQIGWTASVYAFEDGKVEDVSSSYK